MLSGHYNCFRQAVSGVTQPHCAFHQLWPRLWVVAGSYVQHNEGGNMPRCDVHGSKHNSCSLVWTSFDLPHRNFLADLTEACAGVCDRLLCHFGCASDGSRRGPSYTQHGILNRAPGELDILWHFILPHILLPARHRVGDAYNSVTLYWLASLDGVQTWAKPWTLLFTSRSCIIIIIIVSYLSLLPVTHSQGSP